MLSVFAIHLPPEHHQSNICLAKDVAVMNIAAKDTFIIEMTMKNWSVYV
jgi:hypothetical protein